MKKFFKITWNIFKDNFKSFIIFLIVLFFLTVNLPYYIDAPGGLMDTKDKVKSSDNFSLSGSLNMAYVTEIHGTIPTLIWALIDKNWDISKEKDTVASGETVADKNYRNKVLLKESNDLALKLAYDYSDIDYSLENVKVFITYVDELAQTDLKVSDQVLSIDGNEVLDKNMLFSYIKSKSIGDKVTLDVLNDGKKYKRKATLIDVNGEPKIGAMVSETFDLKSSHDVSFDFKESESGSSGGMMLTLTLYCYLNHIDLTGGKTIVGTGTISEDGTIGEIAGVKYKLIGAVNKGASLFIVPKGENYEEAKKVKEEYNYDIDLIAVETFDDVLKYLKNM